MKTIKLALLLLGASLSLHAVAARAAPVDIDVILPLTGPGAFLGKAQQTALIRMQAAIANGSIQAPQPNFLFHDDQSSPQNAVQLATAIAAKKPPVILGSSLVAMCNAMAPLMKTGPVMYCFSPGIHPAAGSFVFTSGVDTKDLAASLIRYWRLKGITRLGLITSTDASGQDAERNIRAIMALPENKDSAIVGDARFNPTDVSVTAQIERIKETRPQALIAWATGGPIATVFKAISAAELDIPVGTTNGNMTYAQMDQYKDFLPKELIIPTSSWMDSVAGRHDMALDAAHAPFYAVFKANNESPDSASTLGWDPTLLILHALGDLGPNATAEQLRVKIAETKGFTGVNGTYDFSVTPQRGLDEAAVVVSRWDAAARAWTAVSGPHGLPASP
jgi:branched-chain amino acid transport system substrate-binding protein